LPDPLEELMELSWKTRQLSAYISKLKDDKTMVTDEAEIERLTEAVKMRQYYAFFISRRWRILTRRSKGRVKRWQPTNRSRIM
jgi:hypothetical protein